VNFIFSKTLYAKIEIKIIIPGIAVIKYRGYPKAGLGIKIKNNNIGMI
jgi:hypothetical protein